MILFKRNILTSFSVPIMPKPGRGVYNNFIKNISSDLIMNIRVACLEHSDIPQRGWKSTGLVKIFDADSDFTVKHPNKSQNIPDLFYDSKIQQYKIGGKTFDYKTSVIKHDDIPVYFCEVLGFKVKIVL